jgi:hypothetical protein
MRGALLGVACALAGCATSLGSVGTLAPQTPTSTKLLRPAAVGRSCRTSILGVLIDAGDPGLEEALGHILALDSEGDVVSNAEVVSEWLVTGIYNRRCVIVRGNLGRTISQIALPSVGEHHH